MNSDVPSSFFATVTKPSMEKYYMTWHPNILWIMTSTLASQPKPLIVCLIIDMIMPVSLARMAMAKT
jgi:hypothetical protein